MKGLIAILVTNDSVVKGLDFDNGVVTVNGNNIPVVIEGRKMTFTDHGEVNDCKIKVVDVEPYYKEGDAWGEVARTMCESGFKFTGITTPLNHREFADLSFRPRFLIVVEQEFDGESYDYNRGSFLYESLIEPMAGFDYDSSKMKILAYSEACHLHLVPGLNRAYQSASLLDLWDETPTGLMTRLREVVDSYMVSHEDYFLPFDPIRLFAKFREEYQHLVVLFPGESPEIEEEWYARQPDEDIPYYVFEEARYLFEKMVGTVPTRDDEEEYGDDDRTREWLRTDENLDRVIKYPIVQSFLLGE